MTTSLGQTSENPGALDRLILQPWFKRRANLLFWAAVVLLALVAILMRLYLLDVHFDRDGYDEGVYWQSLLAMLHGQKLYSTIFYSQPPIFLLSIYPTFALLGGSLWAARSGIALTSLLGFPGAYFLGKSLAGRRGAVAALLLLTADTIYLAESQTIQAEATGTALSLLAIGFAFLWWNNPGGRRGMCWAILTGAALALSILSKLLSVSTLVPIGLLILARVWQIWRKRSGTSWRSWLPILAGLGVALLTTLLTVLPFLGSFQSFWYGVVAFHNLAQQAVVESSSHNSQLIMPVLLSPLSIVALYGTVTAFLRKNWLVIPLLAWFLVTLLLLFHQNPLFVHHLIAFEPPSIALAILGLARPSAYKVLEVKWPRLHLDRLLAILGVVAILVGSSVNFVDDVFYYQNAITLDTSPTTQLDVRVASDLLQAITPDQWVITDGQFIAGLAGRSVPPSLVDTSSVRIYTASITLSQLEQDALNPRVHAILFYSGRFYLRELAGFHAWVAQHFHLAHSYGNQQELWVR